MTSITPSPRQNFPRDMIQIREDIVIESFAAGRDLGIDGRWMGADGYTIIIQAKQLGNTGGRILSIVQKEKEKIDELVERGMRVSIAMSVAFVIKDNSGLQYAKAAVLLV